MMQGHLEKNGLLNFLCDQSEGIASCRVLNCGYFGDRTSKRGVMIYFTIFKTDRWHFL